MLKCNFIVTTFALAMMDKGQEKMVEWFGWTLDKSQFR
jgi:hypothetical protein